MNFLGRFLLFLLTVLVIVVLTVFLLSPTTIGSWSGNISEISPVFRIVIAVLIDLVLLALLVSQLRPARQPTTSGLLMRSTGTFTEVSVDSARERILKAVGDVPDVVSVEAQVKPVRGRADLDLDVEVLGDDVRLPEKQKEIDRALRQVINKQLGLQMAGRPRVRIRLHGDRPVTPTAPKAEAPVVPPPVVVPPPEPKRDEPVFSSLRREPEVVPEKPVPPPVEEPKPEPREGLFGGLFRRDREDDVKPAPEPTEPAGDEEMFADTPELAALLRTTEPVEPSTDAPVTIVVTDEDEGDDEADTINLNLDKELADTAADELMDDHPADAKDDDERPASVTSDEPRQS
ncbi:MAG: hypothetical protein HZC41_16840 [Chloroflexi bacterium]|nr:hypothetical protein [Chloroflexota bacterium]